MAEPNVIVLTRHGESEWNKLNVFTGWKDRDLTDTGVAQAQHAARLLRTAGITFDVAYTSGLKRAQRTLSVMVNELGYSRPVVFKDERLNERDYGDLSGLNKDDARKKGGERQVHIWRRSYDVAPPGLGRHRLCERSSPNRVHVRRVRNVLNS